MKLLNRSILVGLFSYISLASVQAKDVITLPTIQVMAESELREEVGFVPFQEDKQTSQALRHYVYTLEKDIQNTTVNENTGIIFDYQPKAAMPDMSQISPAIQQYILAVATGFQSPDPTNGLFNMLQPLNINRNNIEGIREGSMKINMDDVLKFQQQLQEGIKGLR